MVNVLHASLADADLHPAIRFVQAADPAASAVDGDLWWDTDDNRLRLRNAGGWLLVNVEVGDIVATGTPDGTTYLRGDGAWGTPAGGGGNVLPFHMAGRYYDAAVLQQAGNTTAALAADTLYANLFYAQATSAGGDPSFDRISINVTVAGAGGTQARLGIYEMGSNGRPGARVLDAGTVAVDSTGAKEVTISQSLTAGRFYYTAIVSSGTPTITSYNSMQQAIFGWNAIGGTSFENRWSVAHAFAALPDPFGTPTGSGNALAFRVALRAA